MQFSTMDHGMNPGMVNHFMKKGLIMDFFLSAAAILKVPDAEDMKAIENTRDTLNFPALTQKLSESKLFMS